MTVRAVLRQEKAFRFTFILIGILCFVVQLQAGGVPVQEIVFPQVAFGAGSSSEFSLHNPTTNLIEVHIRAFSNNQGSQFRTTQIPALGTRTISFGPEGNSLFVGWAVVASETGTFFATEFIELLVGQRQLPRMGVLSVAPASSLRLFGFQRLDLETGMAIVNRNQENAEVTIRLFREDGSVRATSTFLMNPNQHLARFMDQFSGFEDINLFEGTVVISSTRPLIVTSLVQDPAGNIATVAVQADPEP